MLRWRGTAAKRCPSRSLSEHSSARPRLLPTFSVFFRRALEISARPAPATFGRGSSPPDAVHSRVLPILQWLERTRSGGRTRRRWMLRETQDASSPPGEHAHRLPSPALHRFRRSHFLRRSNFRKTRRGGDRSDAGAGTDAASLPPPARELCNPSISSSPSDTATAEFGEHDLRQRAEQLPSRAISLPLPRGEHPLSMLLCWGSTVTQRACIRGNPHGLGGHTGLPSPVQPTPSSAARSPTCPLSSMGGASVPKVGPWSASGMSILPLQAGMARCWQLVSSLDHGEQTSHVVRGRRRSTRTNCDNTTVQPGPNHSHVSWN